MTGKPAGEAMVTAALTFYPGLPELKKGALGTFIIWTRNKDGREAVFPAYYLNAHPLNYEEDCAERGCPKGEEHEDGCPTTGWFYDESNFESDNCYHPISADVLAWAALPTVATLSVAPPQAGNSRDEVLEILALWSDANHIRLHAGEMTAQEMRSVKAVVGAITREVRALASRGRE